LGKAATGLLRKYSVQTQNILYGGDRLGIYFLETGAISRSSKVVYDRAIQLLLNLNRACSTGKKFFKDAGWFHWTGITPAISEGAARVAWKPLKQPISWELLFHQIPITAGTCGSMEKPPGK
jgi:2-dehydro-3-deoxygluconokinase